MSTTSGCFIGNVGWGVCRVAPGFLFWHLPYGSCATTGGTSYIPMGDAVNSGGAGPPLGLGFLFGAYSGRIAKKAQQTELLGTKYHPEQHQHSFATHYDALSTMCTSSVLICSAVLLCGSP
jgi:hypothetical protein